LKACGCGASKSIGIKNQNIRSQRRQRLPSSFAVC
jgi:hypothetical protein